MSSKIGFNKEKEQDLIYSRRNCHRLSVEKYTGCPRKKTL